MEIAIPGYTLIRPIGKGGMATVFLATQDALEREVAIKVMSLGLAEDPTFGQRFMREAKIVSRLAHPNIVTVHEVGQHKDYFYLSMEYIDGKDLRSVRKSLDLTQKLRVIEDMARALHYAGEKGYVHRDIKPENIMFRTNDGSSVLTDFGIAKAVETDIVMTQAGTAIGTPHYMSPEQAKGKQVDHRSDLYSLGVVFYLLLTGRVPYDADSAVTIGIKHITEPLPVLPPSLRALQFIIDGLMAKDPANRYQNGNALMADLRSIDIERLVDDSNITNSVTLADEPAILEVMEDSARFTLEVEAVDDEPSSQSSTWPMFFALLFVGLSICVIVYISRPAVLEPYIKRGEHATSAWFKQLRSDAAPHVDGIKNTLSRLTSDAPASPAAEPADTSSEAPNSR